MAINHDSGVLVKKMKMQIGGSLLLTAATALLISACGDSSISKSPLTPDAGCTGFGGCNTGDGGGGTSGGADAGDAATPPGSPCLDDSACTDGNYCLKTGGALEGACTLGCRPDSCGTGSTCDLSTRLCHCSGDEGCAEGEYCAADTGACLTGCRAEPDSCGAGQVCDAASHTCSTLAVCCSGADHSTCALTPETACDGTYIARLDSCDPNPCGPTCQTDGECAADRFCSADGICNPGCRAAPDDTCPDGQFCDPAKHTCQADVAVPCQIDTDCADPTQFCDVVSGECQTGCRQGDVGTCDPGNVCSDQHECVTGCGGDGDCNDGQYCDVAFGCRDFCVTNDNCHPDEFCAPDPAGGRCVEGCRDDDPNGTDNDIATATPIPLVNNHGEVHGALVCPDNPDFYAIELFQAARLQVTLTFDANLGDAQLLLFDANGLLVQDVAPGSPKRVRYPEVGGQGVPQPGTYFVEVISSDPASIAYDLSVTVIDAVNEGCFPDDVEFIGQGNNNQDLATAIDWNGARNESFAYRGSVCGGDEDWWSFPAHDADSGLGIELVVSGLVGEAVVDVYSDSRILLGLGNPNYTTGPGQATPQGTTRYTIDVPSATNGLSSGTWYIRLRGADNSAVLDDYGLNVQLIPPGGPCADDAAEPNDAINAALPPAAILDNAAGISAGGMLRTDADLQVPTDFSLCPGDEDWFRFTAEQGDQISAWATADTLAGQATIEIMDDQGGLAGQAGNMTRPGDATDPAAYNGASAGTYYVRVRSIGAATADPYTLFIRRNPTAMCGADVDEVGPGANGRNDTPQTATLLAGAGGNQERFEHNNGLICDVRGPDLDWYSVNVAEDYSRICVTTDFNNNGGDLDLRLFPTFNNPDDELPCANAQVCHDNGLAAAVCVAGFCGCNADADCDNNHNGAIDNDVEGPCVANRCRLPLKVSTTHDAPEMIDVNRAEVKAGQYFVRVNSDVGDQNSYRLNVTVNPARPDCNADWREQDQPNDDPATATLLGSGEAGVCDAWLCLPERNTGDIYAIDVPAGSGDRTVMLTYAGSTDGLAVMSVLTRDTAVGPASDTYHESPNPPDSFLDCLNIRGTDRDMRVFLLVNGDADRVNPDHPNAQIDYGLRVLTTNLAPGADPTGRCNEAGGNPTNVWTVDLGAP